MNRKDYLKKRNALLTEAETLLNEGKIDEYKAKEVEIKDLDTKFDAISLAQANMNALKDAVPSNVKVVDVIEPTATIEPEDKFNTVDYRKSFMNFCQTGIKDGAFKNVDEYTSSSDAGAVVPTTIMKEIIKEMKVYGQIFAKIRKTNIKGGVEVPILSIKPSATWIGEGSVSDRKKVTVNTNVSFSYYGLECRIAISLLADVTTLDMFETTITGLIVEAMVKALDTAIIKGSGSGQPLGITVDARVPAGNKITLTSADFLTWSGWKKKVFAKIPLAYRAGGSFITAAGTFEGYMDGMTDAQGQPVGRVNYGITEGPKERFGAKPVILVEDDIVAPYDSASVGDIVAVYCKLSDYCINSNMSMQMFRWLDHDTNQWVDKAVLIADGKILDPNGVLIIKKGA